MNKITVTVRYFALTAISLFWLGLPKAVSAQTGDTYNLLTPLPLGEGGSVESTVTTSGSGFADFINDIIVVAIALAAGLAVVMIVIGGIKYMTSESGDGKRSGKEYITNAVGGLILALGSFIILNTINPELVQIRGVEEIDVLVSDRPVKPGWYYERFDATWSDTFGTSIGSRGECEEARAEEEDKREGTQTFECIEITGTSSARDYCWYQDEFGFNYDFQRCFSSLSQCHASQGTGEVGSDEYALRDDVIVECTEYSRPDEDTACLNYDPINPLTNPTVCFPSIEACEAAREYIGERREVEECHTSREGNDGLNNEAQYCVEEIPQSGFGGGQPVRQTICNPKWNDNIEACEAYADQREEGRWIIIERCYTNPFWGGDFADSRDVAASTYTECVSITEGEKENFLCGPSRDDCRVVAETLNLDANNCYTRNYSEGEYNIVRLTEPCLNCKELNSSIPVENNRLLNSEFANNISEFLSVLGSLPIPSNPNEQVTFAVTEAWPPTHFHLSRCHRNGTCIDLNYRGSSREVADSGSAAEAAMLLEKTFAVAEASNLCLNYETFNTADRDALIRELTLIAREKEGGGEKTRVESYTDNILAISGISAPHFSVYMKTSLNCKTSDQ